jgi:hypothetical protein
MFSIRSSINFYSVFLYIFNFLLKKLNYSDRKVHDYTKSVRGQDYVFEFTELTSQGYMTGMGKGVKCGDYILLQEGTISYQYQVEAIDYYSEPSDMWIALLKKVTAN